MAKSRIKASKSSIKPGQTNTINITRDSSFYKHTIKYTVGKISKTVATKTSSASVNITIPLDVIAQSPNKTQTCTVTCTTYNGTSSMGSTTCTFAVAPYPPNEIIGTGFTDGYLGRELEVFIEKSNSNFTSTLNYSFEGSKNTVVATDITATEIAFTPPLDLATYIPNKESGTLTVKVETYYQYTKVGATQTFTMTLDVPKEVKPTITETGWVDTSGYATKYGAPVASKSTIMLTSTAKGIYDSHISKVYYAVNSISKTYTNPNAGELSKDTLSSGMEFPENVISWSANKFVYSITAEDTRGHLSDTFFSKEIAVLSYKAPQIRHSFYRCDASGNKLEDGTYVKFSLIHAFTSLNNKNTKHVNIYRDNTKIYTGELADYNSSVDIVTSGWGRDVTYTFKIELVDDFSTTAVTGKIDPVFSLINFNTNGTALAFGGVSTKSNTVEFYMPLYTDKSFLFKNGSSISMDGNNLLLGTSAVDSYVTLKDAASANGKDKWMLTADGNFSCANGITAGNYYGKNDSGTVARLMTLSGANNVVINPIEDGSGTTNIYGGKTGIVQFGSTSAPVDIRRNGHDIFDTAYSRNTDAINCASGKWVTTKAKASLHKGVWIVIGKVSYAAAAGKRRGIRIYNNTDATAYASGQYVYGGSTTSQTIYVNATMILNISSTKEIAIQAYQDTGNNLNVTEAILQAVCVG